MPSPPTETESAYAAMLALLREYGLESLAPDVLKLLQDGYTQEQVGVLIQDTPEYKKRFAGNEIRRKNGVPVLSPRDYLSVEQAYRQIMSTAGMPASFYDKPNDFAEWIGKDVSPSEVSSRVTYAVDAAERLDAGTLKAFKDWYGVRAKDLAAFFLDQDRAFPLITRIAKGVQLAGNVTPSGIKLSKAEAERLGGLVGDRDVDTLASRFAEAARAGRDLSQRYGGEDYTQADAANEVFEESEVARRRRLNLVGMEEAQFAGSSGVGRSTLTREKNY